MLSDHKHLGRRAALLSLGWALWAAPSAWAQSGAGALPQRNLVVEWRVNQQGQARDSQTGVQRGRIIVDSRRGVIGGADVTLGTVQTESQSQAVQQVRVLNGGRARLYVGQSQPQTVWQWVVQPGSFGQAGQAQAWSQTVWLDLGRGLSVRPSWPGGQAPVRVEFEAQVREPLGYSPDGQIREAEVGSTLRVPLGEWAVVARSGSRSTQQRAGTLSTRELDDEQSEQLEIRITAP